MAPRSLLCELKMRINNRRNTTSQRRPQVNDWMDGWGPSSQWWLGGRRRRRHIAASSICLYTRRSPANIEVGWRRPGSSSFPVCPALTSYNVISGWWCKCVNHIISPPVIFWPPRTAPTTTNTPPRLTNAQLLMRDLTQHIYRGSISACVCCSATISPIDPSQYL